ncbi:hypothetical protein EV644_13548 [Kribbella orskensis]|uniref:Frag1/DRAM/Sfk1 family protein n=2 Tax=Kribbellaceae TaxID=2726069 RepID=A0ABY2B7G2_9ACTN|nr:hypothetical protein EV642_13748 [Kribbella sp. VKM Ac-2500]TCO10248.1 hypothetical protein EV644_13548 [Kribbella orskensis]
MLLSRPIVANNQVQTLSLFLAGFITLALDSYLFAAMTGDSPAPALCVRSRSVGLIASGLLGLGGVAILAGISWLLATAVVSTGKKAKRLQNELRTLELFTQFVLYGTAFSIGAFVAITAVDFLVYGLGDRAPSGLNWYAVVYMVIFAAMLGASRYRKRRSPEPSERFLTFAIFWTVSYAVVGSVGTTAIMTPTAVQWLSAPTGLIWAIAAFTMLGALPAVLALVHAVPQLKISVGNARTGRAQLEPSRPAPPTPAGSVNAAEETT